MAPLLQVRTHARTRTRTHIATPQDEVSAKTLKRKSRSFSLTRYITDHVWNGPRDTSTEKQENAR
jgi:hypothetical protein